MMNDHSTDYDTTVWRLGKLEDQVAAERKAQIAELADHRLLVDELIGQTRKVMREDHFTKDQVENRFVAKQDIAKSSLVHREWLMLLIALISAAGVILQVTGH